MVPKKKRPKSNCENVTDQRITNTFIKRRRVYRLHSICVFLCRMMTGFRCLNSMGASWLFILIWWIYKGNIITLIIMVCWTSRDCLSHRSCVWFIYCGKSSCLIMFYWMRLSLHKINIITQIGFALCPLCESSQGPLCLTCQARYILISVLGLQNAIQNVSWFHTKLALLNALILNFIGGNKYCCLLA